MEDRRHRITLLALTAALMLLFVVALVLYPDGDPHDLPAPLESVHPAPGEIALPQTFIEIDMVPGYELSLVVDGIPIPPGEVVGIAATGNFRWQPGLGSVIQSWTAGEHTIEIAWDRSPGRVPDPGSFTWVFRIT